MEVDDHHSQERHACQSGGNLAHKRPTDSNLRAEPPQPAPLAWAERGSLPGSYAWLAVSVATENERRAWLERELMGRKYQSIIIIIVH